MSLNNMTPVAPAQALSDDNEPPLVTVVVDYHGNGRLSVRCNASGEKVNEMMVQLLEGAITAVREGVGVSVQ